MSETSKVDTALMMGNVVYGPTCPPYPWPQGQTQEAEKIAQMFETCYQSSYLRGDEVAKIIRGRYCK